MLLNFRDFTAILYGAQRISLLHRTVVTHGAHIAYISANIKCCEQIEWGSFSDSIRKLSCPHVHN